MTHSLRHENSRLFSERIVRWLEEKPFSPHPLFRNGHAQTILAFAWPRYLTMVISVPNEERLFELEPNVRLLAHCHWQTDRVTHPTLLLVHGLEGSSSSKYMFGTAEKAFRSGFNVIRLNLRNCGGTEHLTPTLYHSGMTGDLRAIVRELIEGDHLRSIFLIGFSMGGNMILKFAGEDANTMPEEVSGFCAVSPSIDLSSCAEAVRYRSNWVYEQYFLRSLCRRLGSSMSFTRSFMIRAIFIWCAQSKTSMNVTHPMTVASRMQTTTTDVPAPCQSSSTFTDRP